MSPALAAWVAEALGVPADSLELEALGGATSSAVYRVRGAEPAVLRCHTNGDWLAREPDLARHEAQALAAAAATGLPVPRLLGVWDGPAPAVLMTELPGAVELPRVAAAGWLAALAAALAAIHATPVAIDWRYGCWTREDQLAVPEWTARPALWQRAINRFRAGPSPWATTFIHRDFHPANVLWRDGRISGVVDWVNACAGPAGIDVAHCRSNLAHMYGIDAARAFLDSYREQAPEYRHDAHWDIEVVLGALPEPRFYAPWAEFGLDRIEPRILRVRLEALLNDAMAAADDVD